MTDEIIRELWKVKDDMARECNYDIETLVKSLHGKKQADNPKKEKEIWLNPVK